MQRDMNGYEGRTSSQCTTNMCLDILPFVCLHERKKEKKKKKKERKKERQTDIQTLKSVFDEG